MQVTSIYDARATRRKRDDVHVREGTGYDGRCGAMNLARTESELTAETSAPCKYLAGRGRQVRCSSSVSVGEVRIILRPTVPLYILPMVASCSTR